MVIRFDSEQEFWDTHVPGLQECLRQVEAGPDPTTARAVALLEPLERATILDVGCGAGIFGAWLARAGASVTGIDISPVQVARAAELHEQLGLSSRFVVAPLSRSALGGDVFDCLAGRYVLHHLDPPSVSRELATLLRPGGRATFVETMGLNPILRFARSHVAGRLGIPRYGTRDERPLSREDLRALETAFGELRLETVEMQFLRIFDRQVLHYRSRFVSRILRRFDDALMKVGLASWSYHQVVCLNKPALGEHATPARATR